MQLTAKLVQVLPLQTGQGKNGEWRKQDIILETDGQYPRKMCIAIWGDRINNDQLVVGNNLTIDFDIESREFNGRWYTDVKAWRVEVAGAMQTGATQAGAPNLPMDTPPVPGPAAMPPLPENKTDDLPF
ncbi:MAG: DUF3127 domain-containing protein [Dysgonamonadaceae bacterium]|jgi:hypothetical protein|nr:DUF3127 domain-containing protein [Dysgonamonadaceae bacterium]